MESTHSNSSAANSPGALLPAQALARWRTLEETGLEHNDPTERVARWLARLRARMICTGGRLTPLLIATGLSDVETLVACVWAQLDAGTMGEGQFSHDVEADMSELVEIGPLDILEAFSSKLATLSWLGDRAENLHGEVARRLLDAGNEPAVEAVLERMTSLWGLIDWLEHYGTKVSTSVRAPLVKRAELLVDKTPLPPSNRVDVLVRLANLTGERGWLERAREIWATMSQEELDNSGYVTPLSATLARGFAEQNAFDDAIRIIDATSPDDRYSALVELTPMLPEGTTRTKAIAELLDGVMSAERSCWQLVSQLPETLGRVLVIVEALNDDEKQLEDLASLVEYLDPKEARRVCELLLASAGRDPSSPGWSAKWSRVLASLTTAGLKALLDEATRRWLIDILLDNPDDELWPEVAAFVPDDRAEKVLDLSRARLAIATHYTERDTWIEVGFAVLERVPKDQAKSWREIAAVQMARTSIESHREGFDAWSQDQRREIVLARLRQHQVEFLPSWEIEPWLRQVRLLREARASDAIIVPAVDERERAEALDNLETLTSTTAWPTLEHVRKVFESLAFCDGEDAVKRALAGID